MAIKKVPAFPAVAIGALLGGVWAAIFQPEVISTLADKGASQLQLLSSDARRFRKKANVFVEKAAETFSK